MVVAPELEGIEVVSVGDGRTQLAANLVGPELLSKIHVTAIVTHFADFNAWEYAQRLMAAKAELAQLGVEVTMIGIGTRRAGAKFAELLDLPTDRLYAEPKSACHKALGCSPGALPDLDFPPAAKLLAMIAGVGSPGTIEAGLRGVFGDPRAKSDWVSKALQQGAAKGRFPADLPATAFDKLGTTGIHPFELATLRLQNTVQGILASYGALAPSDSALALQQGSTLAYDWRGERVYGFEDGGILVYTPVDEMITAIKESIALSPDGGKAFADALKKAGENFNDALDSMEAKPEGEGVRPQAEAAKPDGEGVNGTRPTVGGLPGTPSGPSASSPPPTPPAQSPPRPPPSY
jgi:hypothetical protein